jgi:hypothetical protein
MNDEELADANVARQLVESDNDIARGQVPVRSTDGAGGAEIATPF